MGPAPLERGDRLRLALLLAPALILLVLLIVAPTAMMARLALPYVVLVVHARLMTIQTAYEEAAATLGANRFQVFREITLPLLMPAVVAGLLLSFTLSFDNVTASIFWRPVGTETLPTQIYSMLRDSVSPEINALGTVMVAITVGLPLIAIAAFRIRAQKRL